MASPSNLSTVPPESEMMQYAGYGRAEFIQKTDSPDGNVIKWTI
jgi:hypothetical protein